MRLEIELTKEEAEAVIAAIELGEFDRFGTLTAEWQEKKPVSSKRNPAPQQQSEKRVVEGCPPPMSYAELEEILRLHGLWLANEEGGRCADLSRAWLIGADLSKVVLRNADLSGNTFLLSIDLSNADLSNANLSKAVLRDANLSGADLRGANLNNAALPLANLSGADLRDAKLFEAVLRDANLSGADLRGADLRFADLCRAKLRGAQLIGAFLTDEQKEQAIF